MSECELSARVIPGDSKCEAYRRSGSVTCRYCELGPSIKTVGADTMKKVCSVKGCSTAAHARGMCWAHERSELGIDPGTGKKLVVVAPAAKLKTAAVVGDEVFAHIEKAAKVQVKEVVEPVAPALVMTEMDMELDQLFKAKRAAWLSDLAGATTIRSRARMFLAMSDSLEGMVY